MAATMISAQASASCTAKVAAAPRQTVGLVRMPLGKATNEWSKKTVSNGIKTRQMMVWQPLNNKMFETFSYLPPLSDDQIARQVSYITGNNWTPCLEFADAGHAYVSDDSTVRFGPVSSLYQDNRYWTMWKLPMFGCTDPGQVLKEIGNCRRAFPDCYIRLVAFDADRQVQVTGFLVQRPLSAKDWQRPERRSV